MAGGVVKQQTWKPGYLGLNPTLLHPSYVTSGDDLPSLCLSFPIYKTDVHSTYCTEL